MAEREADSVVSEECIKELLDFFSRGSYKAKSVDRRNEIIHKMCIHLIARDYDVEVIDNEAGQLCGHYPSELIVIERQRTDSSSSSSSRQPSGRLVNNAAQLRQLIASARYARCRSRFIVPVILFEDKNVCRSATLSTMAEMYGRAGIDWFTGTYLLQRDPAERLGCMEDREPIRSHPFFKDIDFVKLEDKKLRAPFRPTVKSSSDASNFDDDFTFQPAQLTPTDHQLVLSIDQTNFAGFSFTSDLYPKLHH